MIDLYVFPTDGAKPYKVVGSLDYIKQRVDELPKGTIYQAFYYNTTRRAWV